MKSSFMVALLSAAVLATGGALVSFGADGRLAVDFSSAAQPHVRGISFEGHAVNTWGSQGRGAYRFTITKPWQGGYPEWPSVTFPSAIKDWTSYDRLVVDVLSVGLGGDFFMGFVSDSSGHVGAGMPYPPLQLKTDDWQRWVIPLDWRKGQRGKAGKNPVDVRNITRVHFNFTAPFVADVEISGLYLLKPGDPLPEPCAEYLREKAYPARERARAKRTAALKTCREQLAERCRAAGQDGEPCWIGQATPMEKVMPKSTFDVRAADRFSIKLARGESEATQVVVLPSGDRTLKDVSVEVGELKASDGTILPASAISAHPVGYVETKNPGPYAAGYNVETNLPGGYCRQKRPVETGWYPEPIMSYLAKTDITRGVAQSFWVNCRAPRDQRKGVYSGVLTVKGEGFAKTFPIDVRVYGFEVPVTSPLPLAVSFHPGGNPPYAQGFDAALADSIGKDPESPLNSWSRHRTEWADFLADHYVSPDHLYGTRGGWWEELVRLKREGRLGRFNLGFWVPVLGRQEPTEAQIASNIVEQVAYLRPQYLKAKELGLLDHAYIYGCDECPAYFFRRVNPVLAAFRREFPGVKLLTTTYDESFGTATNSCQFDAYTPTTDRYAAVLDKIPSGRAIGKEVWWYIACNQRAPLGNPFIEDQLIAFRQLMGAQTVKFRPDGFLYYQISIWNSLKPISGESVFTDWNPISFSTIHGDGNLLCCGPDGTPLTTVRFEAFRDGLEDFAYAKEYERVTGRTCEVPPEVCRGIDQYTDNPSTYYAWRDGLAEEIERADLTRTGGWCYKVGACEAWQLKLTVDESNAALCKVGWPGVFEYPSVEPECFWSEAPVDGYDFIPGERDVPPHRCVRPVHEVIPVRKGRLYDLGREEIGFVVCKAKERPKLFVGESEEEANNDDWNGFEQVTVMDRAENGEWRSKYPLALRYFRFDGKESDVRFLSQVDRREPKIRYQAPNERAARIWRTAVETLRLSTRTFLLDGPKRDRLPWMGDFVVSCLANAHSFADPEPCKRSLVAVGTPARLGHVNGIGAYSLWWVVGHDLVQQKFPDRRFLRLHYPRIRERVNAFDRHVDGRGYYVKDLQWNFLDWTDSKGGELKSETTLQVIYFAALKSAVRLAEQVNDVVSAKMWDAKAEALRASLLAQGMDETRHARVLAIVFDLVDGDEARKYAAEIVSGNLPPTVTPYMSTMEVWALMKAGETEAARLKFESVWGVIRIGAPIPFGRGLIIRKEAATGWSIMPGLSASRFAMPGRRGPLSCCRCFPRLPKGRWTMPFARCRLQRWRKTDSAIRAGGRRLVTGNGGTR